MLLTKIIVLSSFCLLKQANGQKSSRASDSQHDSVLLMLEAIRLLALKLSAVSTRKLLLLQEDQLQQVRVCVCLCLRVCMCVCMPLCLCVP